MIDWTGVIDILNSSEEFKSLAAMPLSTNVKFDLSFYSKYGRHLSADGMVDDFSEYLPDGLVDKEEIADFFIKCATYIIITQKLLDMLYEHYKDHIEKLDLVVDRNDLLSGKFWFKVADNSFFKYDAEKCYISVLIQWDYNRIDDIDLFEYMPRVRVGYATADEYSYTFKVIPITLDTFYKDLIKAIEEL